jgi:hypothetical protein
MKFEGRNVIKMKEYPKAKTASLLERVLTM